MITLEQVLALAPDAAAQKAARELAAARKWTGLGQSERSVWGEHKGSGKDPYQTRVDLRALAFKCTCPSRKLPCKHSLGLLLALVESPVAFPSGAEPAWVSEWLGDRDSRAEKKAKKNEGEPPAAIDLEAREKRAAKRALRVEDGLEELALWLRDLAREGFASVAQRPVSFFEGMAARLIDAQAPGAARLVSALGGIARSGGQAHRRLISQAARLHLLVEGHGRLHALPPETQADIRAALGFTVPSDEVLRGPAVAGPWQVLGRRIEVEDRLRVARTWLWHKSRDEPALILTFAAGAQPLEASHAPGTEVDAELAFYPGAVPLRALEKSRQSAPRPLDCVAGGDCVRGAVLRASRAFSSNPWLERFPVRIAAVTPMRTGDRWLVRDPAGAVLSLSPRWSRAWELLAASGGRGLGLFGEWDGRELWPLSVWTGQQFFDLGVEAPR